MQLKQEFPGSFKPKFIHLVIVSSALFLCGCQIPYYLKSAWHQSKILKSRVPIEKAVKDPELSQDTKDKLVLAQKARIFAEQSLKLDKTKNYTSFVRLDRPYVSYILRAAPVYELKHYLWSFPIVGDIPYKGYFSEDEAIEASKDFSPKEYDTYVRGASAYSTLGWFNDPILSSMLSYRNHDLVNTIIHETVHATVYIKNYADFNERLASFVGDIGTELYYLKAEGPESKTLKKIKLENKDSKLFSDFISKELENLKKWYKKNKGNVTKDNKTKRLKKIQSRFLKNIAPLLKVYKYSDFQKRQLNNANLLSLQTYVYNMEEFYQLYVILDKDFTKLIKYCKDLEKSEDPEKELTSFVQFHKNHEESVQTEEVNN